MKNLAVAVLLSALSVPAALNAVSLEIPRDTSFTAWSTYMHVKKSFPEAELLPDSLPPGVSERLDVVYSTLADTPFGERSLHVDIFRPDDGKVYPALIMIHGGGWNSGDKSLQRPMAQRIAARGYVTIPVEYRLIPEALYPAGLHDIKAAVRWVRANAAGLGVDPDKIAVSGCSAGGQLATLVGVTNGSARHEGEGRLPDFSSDVQAVVNMDGVSTFVSESNIAEAADRLAKKGKMSISAVWLGGLYEDARENWHEASAVEWVTPASAPVCFISSGLPRYSGGRETLVELYGRHGIYTESHSIPVSLHPFWFFTPWAGPTVDYAVSFLNKLFK